MARNTACKALWLNLWVQSNALPRHVYSPNSEVSVSNDGKIPGFCKFLFLSSVIKFDNEMSEVKTKITIAQVLFIAKSKFTLQDGYDVIYHQVIPSFWK